MIKSPESWEHMEMMINEGIQLDQVEPQSAVEWLESQPLTPPHRYSERGGSSGTRRAMFDLVDDHISGHRGSWSSSRITDAETFEEFSEQYYGKRCVACGSNPIVVGE